MFLRVSHVLKASFSIGGLKIHEDGEEISFYSVQCISQSIHRPAP